MVNVFFFVAPSWRLYPAAAAESWTTSRSPERCNPFSVLCVFPLALPTVSLTCFLCPRGVSWAASLPGSTGFTQCRGAAQFTGPLGFLSILPSYRDCASSLQRASVWQLKSLFFFFFFPPLLVNDDQKVRSDRQNHRRADLYWELVCL